MADYGALDGLTAGLLGAGAAYLFDRLGRRKRRKNVNASSNAPPRSTPPWRATLLRTVVICVVAFAQGLLRGVWDGLPVGFTSAVVRSHWLSFVVLLGTVALAFGLFEVRRRFLLAYSWIEFGVGFVTAWVAVLPLQDATGIKVPHEPERVLKIVAAIYLMIRALDNNQKAREAIATAVADENATTSVAAA